MESNERTTTGTWPRGFDRDTVFSWPLVRADALVKLNYGKALLAAKRSEGVIPVFGTNGQCGWHNEALAPSPGLILGRKGMGNLGVKWTNSDYWVIDTAYFVTPISDAINLRYFYHLINYIGLNHLKDGTSNPSLSRDTFYAQLLPLPPLSEQKAIAAILGSLDDKIELNRRMNKTLEDFAAAVFKSWFIDFAPVKAKAAGAKSFPSMPQAVFDALPNKLNESSLGEIPEGWPISTIGAEVRVQGGSTPSTTNPEFWEGGVHCWATPKDLSKLESPILSGTERRITDAGLSGIGSGLLPKEAVLLSSRAPIGYLAIAKTQTAINQGFIGMVCNGRLSSPFVLNWCYFNMDRIKGRANGTTFQEISKSNFRPMPVVVPSIGVMQAFSGLATPLYDSVAAQLSESRSLILLRDTLLPKLLSGDLKSCKKVGMAYAGS